MLSRKKNRINLNRSTDKNSERKKHGIDSANNSDWQSISTWFALACGQIRMKCQQTYIFDLMGRNIFPSIFIWRCHFPLLSAFYIQYLYFFPLSFGVIRVVCFSAHFPTMEYTWKKKHSKSQWRTATCIQINDPSFEWCLCELNLVFESTSPYSVNTAKWC